MVLWILILKMQKKRMSDGYHDAIQILKGNIKIHNMFENQRENDKQWDKLYQKLE